MSALASHISLAVNFEHFGVFKFLKIPQTAPKVLHILPKFQVPTSKIKGIIEVQTMKNCSLFVLHTHILNEPLHP